MLACGGSFGVLIGCLNKYLVVFSCDTISDSWCYLDWILIGDILAPSFSMEEGVIFQGLCDMGVSRLEDLGKSDSMENVHDLKTHRDHKLLSREA